METKLLGVALCAGLLSVGSAGAVTLTNGFGDGSVTVDVTEFGSFGSSAPGAGDAFFNPVGSIGTAGTTYESFVYIAQGGVRLTTDDAVTSAFVDNTTNTITNVRVLSQSSTELITEFNVGLLNIFLNQSLEESFDGPDRVGSVLNQVFTINNTTSLIQTFDLVRYIDGDLDFDGSIDDSGGAISTAGNQILFETDSSSSGSASDTFLGITSVVQGPNQVPAGQDFEISSFSGLKNKIEAGGTLNNTIENDNNGDNFIDQPYDVTMAQRRAISLNPNSLVFFTTQTLFGNAVPPSPGDLEAIPLLPDDLGPNGGFVFNIAEDDFDPGQTIWIDPDIATGYTYSVTGAEFASVTAPSFASVPDGDMTYTLTFGAMSVSLASGDTFDFIANGGPVTDFTITGIDVGLMLDPTDTMAFITGVSLVNFGGPSATITQTPIITTIGTPVVPLPASSLLLLGGLGGFVFLRRRKA